MCWSMRSGGFERHLDRSGLLGTRDDDLDLSGEGDPESNLASSAVSGQSPPAGPQWSSGLRPLRLRALAYDKPLCASLAGFTLHAATRAGGLDAEGREALLRYVLRPPIAQERVEQRADGLVRITLKKAYADGTVAVDMDPLSLLCRLATSVPPPRFHTIHYAGVLAAASPWRSRVSAQPPLGGRRLCPRPRRMSNPRRGCAKAGIAHGRNFWNVRSRWTFSLAPVARGR
jgi:hypothetical protein